MKSKLIVFGVILFLQSHLPLWAGSSEEIERFSSFKLEALQKIKPGEILTAKGSLMRFERGISSETCYLAAYPVEKVLNRVVFWDQTPYPDLGILIQGKIASQGTPDFSKLSFNPSLRPISKFIDKNRDTRPNESPLHLSVAEATRIASAGAALDSNSLNPLWGSILESRFTAYLSGGMKGQPPYSTGKTSILVNSEVDSILAQQPAVAKQFGSLFEKIKSAPADADHYWQLQTIDGTAVLVLGSVYQSKLENGVVQVIDLQWFVTGGYYTAFTCYELHPLEIGKTSATLVWRGDYTSISMKQLRKGVERMFSVNVMIQEVKKSIRCFLQDLSKK